LRFPHVPLAYSNFVMTDSGEKNSILNNVEIKGTIRFSKELMFDGTLDGDIFASQGGTLIVGANGKIQGNIRADGVVVKGKVKGDITAGSRCELHGGAELVGDLKTARLVLEAGAMFVGRSEVNPSNVPIVAPSASEAVGAPADSAVAPVSAGPKAASPSRQGTLPGVKGQLS
jgi:cytoskeletal protein CcmA (bactofilin family)